MGNRSNLCHAQAASAVWASPTIEGDPRRALQALGMTDTDRSLEKSVFFSSLPLKLPYCVALNFATIGIFMFFKRNIWVGLVFLPLWSSGVQAKDPILAFEYTTAKKHSPSKQNEDVFGDTQLNVEGESVYFYGLYDGHGSELRTGKNLTGVTPPQKKLLSAVFAQYFHERVTALLAEKLQGLKYQKRLQEQAAVTQQLEEAIEQADVEASHFLLEQAALQEKEDRKARHLASKQGATMACALVIGGQTIYVAHRGDSRVVVLNQNAVKHFTLSHQASDPTEADVVVRGFGADPKTLNPVIVLHPRAGARLFGSLAVTRFIGHPGIEEASLVKSMTDLQGHPYHLPARLPTRNTDVKVVECGPADSHCSIALFSDGFEEFWNASRKYLNSEHQIPRDLEIDHGKSFIDSYFSYPNFNGLYKDLTQWRKNLTFKDDTSIMVVHLEK